MLAGKNDVRAPVGEWERLLDQMLPYFAYAQRFHWPPSVVDGESVIRMRALLSIAEVYDEVERSSAGRQRDVLIVEQVP